MSPEWLEAEVYRRMAVARYNDTPGQILARVRHLLAVPWRAYRG